LDINKFISPEKRETGKKLMEENEASSSANEMLGSALNQIEICFFLSWMRANRPKPTE
jgi:hypothetical protein